MKKFLPVRVVMSTINMPIPSNLTMFWSFGSLLSLCLVSQVTTGLFLSMHYTNNTQGAFDSVVAMCTDVEWGWVLKYGHCGGASFIFILIYVHVGRGIYFFSWELTWTWAIGGVMLLLMMAAAFFGYVLPWGQMSYWGATVITNLVSTVPYVGSKIVFWVWGGFSVGQATLNRFYSFHFIIPFIILALVGAHLMFLHETGSNNPLGLENYDKVSFHPLLTFKDFLGFSFFICLGGFMCFFYPFVFNDPENFTEASPLVTPVHIQPEWYYLFAYAILRAIPNKLGGVAALLASILFLFLLPFLKKPWPHTTAMKKFKKVSFCFFVGVFFVLTWLGSKPVEEPYSSLSVLFTALYFLLFFCM